MEVRLTLDAVKNIDEYDLNDVLNANDYAALKALYNRTSGENWTTNTGWDVSSETPPKASDVVLWHGVTVAGSRVTKIGLDENNLSGTLPSEYGSLSKLQILDLAWNDLHGTLPSELGSLSNLRFFRLYHNELSGTLPSFLGGAIRLA